MNKNDLIHVLERVVSTRKEASASVEAVLRAIQMTLRSGEKVVLSGIGSFHVKMARAKMGRNPRTGEAVPIPPTRRVRFKASKELFQSGEHS
jgi:DNA-binding protein HU-beta